MHLALLTLPAWLFGGNGSNLHEVVPGVLYRSAQLDAKGLAKTIGKDHIASVLNLRGGSDRDGFYRDEVSTCARLGVQHADVPMSASRLPTPDELHSLLAAFDGLPRPILVHCRAGKDRTGLAVTLFESIEEGQPLDKAKATGLAHRYGHTGWGKAAAMDRFVDLYRKTADGKDFRSWIDTAYPSLYAASKGRG